jgi:hypothetical protein
MRNWKFIKTFPIARLMMFAHNDPTTWCLEHMDQGTATIVTKDNIQITSLKPKDRGL